MMTADLPMPRPPAAAPSRRWRDRAFALALLGLFLTGLIGLAAATGWEATRAELAKLSLWQVGVLLLLALGNYGLRALRWHIFARKLGLTTGFVQNLRHYIGGFAMTVTPGRVGELVRMRWLRRETGWAFSRTAPLVLVDRAFDLAAMAVLLAISATLAAGSTRGALPVTVLALAAALVVTRPSLMRALATLSYRLIGRFPRFFGRARLAAASLARFGEVRVVALCLGLGLAGWFAEGVAFHLLLAWLGADIGLWKAAAIFVVATLAGGLTGAPGGVGGAEAAMIGLLTLEGVPVEVSLPATAIIRVTTLWFAIALGALVFPLAERLSLRDGHALEDR